MVAKLDDYLSSEPYRTYGIPLFSSFWLEFTEPALDLIRKLINADMDKLETAHILVQFDEQHIDCIERDKCLDAGLTSIPQSSDESVSPDNSMGIFWILSYFCKMKSVRLM